MSGTFIVFEGGEGSGKTHHANAVAKKLEAEGYEVVLTRQPGDTATGAKIREIILSKSEESLSSRAELFLFLADRAQHVDNVIKPALEAGKVVICDRYSYSTYAYQLGGRQLEQPDFIKQMDLYARAELEPQTVIYLDITPAAGVQRKRDGGQELDRMDEEEVSFHERVRSSFLEQAEQGNWTVIPTQGPIEENEEKIYSAAKGAL